MAQTQKHLFVVKIADLERGAKTVTWPIPVDWLASVLEGAAAPRGDEGVLEVEFTKNGNDVLVRGELRVNVLVPCVVTLDPLPFELAPEIFLMLSKAPTPPPPPRPARPGKHKDGAAAPATPVTRAGRGRVKADKEAWADPELSDGDVARDVYEGDKIVLDDFVREFILLELPMYPRRSDLPPEQTPATDSPPSPGPSAQASVDPRLLPLAELRDRLQKNEKE